MRQYMLWIVVMMMCWPASGWTRLLPAARPAHPQPRYEVQQAQILVPDATTRSQLPPALHRFIDKVKSRTAHIRQLAFIEPIPVRTFDTQLLHTIVKRELARMYGPGQLEAYRTCLVLLGVLPEDALSLEVMIERLLGEQVAGLYDYTDTRLYISQTLEPGSSLAGMILSHELCHALQDQHFDLADTAIEDVSNEDRQLAVTAVAEGDATALMIAYEAHAPNPEALLSDMAQLTAMDQSQYLATPEYFQVQLLFPYLRGLLFLSYVTGGGTGDPSLLDIWDPDHIDWDLVDDVWRDLPSSTEQILHPEKYLSEPRDEPHTVTLPDQPLGPDWQLAYANTYGEQNIRSILAAHTLTTRAERAAAGWGGDRYGLYQHNNQQVLFWRTVWDEPGDAVEFANTLRRVVRTIADNDTAAVMLTPAAATVDFIIGPCAVVQPLAP